MRTVIATDADRGIDGTFGQTLGNRGGGEQQPTAHSPLNEGAR